MATLTLPSSTASADGVRPVNLKTDLEALADLIEMAFAQSMDSGGRAAIREMRSLSHVGLGLNMLANMNDMMQGVGLGFVYVTDGRIVGNVSIYPATLPREADPASIIANVAVHPDYRGRGIARALMNRSLDVIGQRGGVPARGAAPTAILQVETQNAAAVHLYDTMGFRTEGVWTTWKRHSSTRLAPASGEVPYITHRRRGEWRDEMALARSVRSAAGGIGWLRPLVPSLFNRGVWRSLVDAFNLRSVERLIVRPQDALFIGASLWIEAAFAASSVQLTLMVAPDYTNTYGEALLKTAVRRFGTHGSLQIEHPADDDAVSALLERLGFMRQRTLTHMRWVAG